MNEKALKKYLKEKPTQTDRSNLLFGILVLPIFFICIPLFAPPFHLSYILLIVPFIILDIWILAYRFSKSYHSNKQDSQYYLIRGIFGCLFSFGCFLVSQKIAYTMLMLETPWYFILTFLGYLLILFLHFKTRLNKLKEIQTKKKKQNYRNTVAVAGTAAGLGYLVYNMFLKNSSENITNFILIIVMLFFSIITMHFILDLHKYMVIKTYNKKGNSI